MISVKIHDSYRRVVAVCDSDIVGKKFEEGKMQLDLRSNFYQEKEMNFEEAIEFIKRQKMEDASLNIVGKESINASIKACIITERNVAFISDIPFTLTFL